ncbi:methyltransferase [Streptomyces fumigatiscleroticus]|nr:methyltransferase [Streptomyces fumigatiscleroticus]
MPRVSAEPPEFVRTTRASYDTMAQAYADRFPDSLAEQPLDRALVKVFADFVRAAFPASPASAAPPPVADVGSGPGHVTAWLRELGLPVFGVDVSPRMVALARRSHPGLRFHVGSMTSLDLPDETLGGVLALYSIIHVPDGHLADAFAEFHRVLVPGGHVLLCFQAGKEGHVRLTERFGHAIQLDYYWRTPETVADRLSAAGLRPRARVLREPLGEETRPRAFLLADKPAGEPAPRPAVTPT